MLYQMIWFLYVPFQWCWQEYVRPYLINENVGNIIQRINHYPVETYLQKKQKLSYQEYIVLVKSN